MRDMETLKNPYEEKKEAVNPWPEDDQAGKSTTKQIGHLMSSLILHVNLTKQAKNLDDNFPGLQGIRAEAENAKGRAAEIMRELLEAWK